MDIQGFYVANYTETDNRFIWHSINYSDADHEWHEFEPRHGFTRVLDRYLLPALSLISTIISLAALITIARPSSVARNHTIVYLVGLIVSLALYSFTFFCIPVFGQSLRSDNPKGLPILCNIFFFIRFTSYKSYILIIGLALLDRLLQVMANRNNFPTSNLLRLSRWICNHTVARVAVCIAYLMCACASWVCFAYPMTLEYDTCVVSEPYHILMSSGLSFEISLHLFVIIALLRYSLLCCMTPRTYQELPMGEIKHFRLQSSARIQDDRKATSLILCLAVLHLYFNTSDTGFEIYSRVATEVSDIATTLAQLFWFVSALHSITVPLLCLLYWPRAS